MTKERPEVLSGKTIRATTNCGYFYLTLNEFENELFEVKMELGKSGTCIRTLVHFVGVLFSILLQHGIKKEELEKILKKHLVKINCGEAFTYNGKDYTGCLDWIADKILEELKPKEKDEHKQ